MQPVKTASQPSHFKLFFDRCLVKASIVLEKVKSVAIAVFKAAAFAFLFYFNPSLFAISFTIGVVWNDKAREAIEKIHHVIMNQKMITGAFALMGAFLSLPVTIAWCSIYGGLHLGCDFAEQAGKFMPKAAPAA